MPKKTVADAGADSCTPSVPQYFSWINNTNEGSTEAQTLTNLAFFAWLKREYGMQIRIYAWDAGNFDGAGHGYGDPDGEKFRSQYPRGYGPVVERAAAAGIRLGLWGSPDGFGDTPEEEKKRYDFMVDLCRKYHFALFKIDAVCGQLRPEKAEVYARMLQDCRKYSPDLIVLNHRLDLHGAEKYTTTQLWQGVETYVDVHSRNSDTCMHHRGFIFSRGYPEGLDRLLEDHGVCISSAIDYFEDDLIYQAFGRCLILAPEIYGNPWFMRDDEFPKLARIYNLHRRCAPILVDGLLLPASYGDSPISRGTPSHRFIVTGNNSWKPRTVTLRLGTEIGMQANGEKIALIRRHPSEELLGVCDAGTAVEVTLDPFRAYLFEAAAVSEAYPVLEDCEYEMIRENESGEPVEVKMLRCGDGEITLNCGGERSAFGTYEKTDRRPPVPVYLGTMHDAPECLSRGEELYEAAQFGIDNDSLEARSLRRSGRTAVPEVQAARDAFFSQKTYLARGCEGRYAFDDRYDTYFDGYSRMYCGGIRIEGGCLRVDFGRVYDADAVEITCFAIDEPRHEILTQIFPETGSYACELSSWQPSGAGEKKVVVRHETAPLVSDGAHLLYTVTGQRVTVRYPVGALRYFRLPEPMDRIYEIRLTKNGMVLPLDHPTVSNLQAAYGRLTVAAVKSVTLTLPEIPEGRYLAVAVEGVHGKERAYCAAECEGKLLGFPDRAPSYCVNLWEHCVHSTDRNNTFYLPLDPSLSSKEITLYTLLCDPKKTDVRCDVYLCPRH
jgi:hypothetical protein